MDAGVEVAIVSEDGMTGTGTDDDPYVLPTQVIRGDGDDGMTGTGTTDDPYVLPTQVIRGDGDGDGA
jgi:hypothetical protein